MSLLMEGPSIVIAREEFKRFLKAPIRRATGTAPVPLKKLRALRDTASWGKHLILRFGGIDLRVHFLMFGSYRINKPREHRVPKLLLDYGKDKIYFYSCAIKELPAGWKKTYDWSADLMGSKWSGPLAVERLRTLPATEVADALMDQEIFSGLGNIMKNEILFLRKLHPETKLGQLSLAQTRALVSACEDYAWQFYEWKKANVLKRNWKIMRKKKCPVCGGAVTKRATGKLKRISHFCGRCQVKPAPRAA